MARRDLTVLQETKADAARFQQVTEEDINAAQQFWRANASRTYAGLITARAPEDTVPRTERLGGL